ncbi:hypothetical protein DSECCO2_173270 [anaerobic digester metagenome]
MPQQTDDHEITVDHYFFWLSEYCTRNFYSTKMIEDIELKLKKFITLFNLHHNVIQHNKSHKNIFFDYFIIENSEDLKKIVSTYNNNDKSAYNEEIYNMHITILKIINEIELKTFKEFPWKITTPDKIVEKILNEEHFTYKYTPPSFGKFFMKSIIPTSDKSEIFYTRHEDGSIVLSEMKIDITQGINMILSEFFIIISSLIYNEMPIKDGNSLQEQIKQYKNHCIFSMKNSAEISYTQKSDKPRALGIWLWDFVNENKCSVKAAIREMKKHSFLEPFGYSKSSDRVFFRMFSQTSECINKCEVLAMSKQ